MGMDPDLDDTVLKAKIIQFANLKPEKFLDLTDDIDQEYRVFLKKAENKKVLTRINGVWKNGSLNIGLSDEQAIVWLKDNADIYALLRKQVRTGKVEEIIEEPVMQEEMATEAKPTSISGSAINQMEQETKKSWFNRKNK